MWAQIEYLIQMYFQALEIDIFCVIISYISNNHSWTLWFSGHSQLSLAIKGKQSRLLAWLKLKSFHSLRSIFLVAPIPLDRIIQRPSAVAVTSVVWDSWKVVRLGTEHSVLSICCSPRVLALLWTHYFPEVLWILCGEMIGRGENHGAGCMFCYVASYGDNTELTMGLL